MFKKRLLVLAVTTALSGSVLAAELRKVENPVPGQYIVVFQEDAIRSQVQDALAARAGRADAAAERAALVAEVENTVVDVAAAHDLSVGRVFSHVLQGAAVTAEPAAIEKLLNDPRVAYVEENAVFTTSATQTNATWGLDRVDQRNLPLNTTYIYDYTAPNVRAYIIDTGIRTGHTQFGTRLLSGYTSISDGNGTNDCNGHGTHVAGTVAGTTWGVAKAARVVPVRVFGCGNTTTTDAIVAGIDWVRLNHVKPAVANLSLGGGASTVLDGAINNLNNAGVTAVVAAGNNNANACNYSPARVANAVTVGSTTSSDARSSFSNWGTCVNIFAPGSSITSAWHTSTSASAVLNGTSMAAPHVAGAAALYLETNPTATPATVRNWLYTNATTGVLTGIGTGSPNRLLYTR
ncbi:S8 family peptidase [Luteimonas sp. Y-2-2-4F]|nr:S8 family peptidase [Luteimonas sp. Y-2-2-4F]MCD9032859.1 S8 family peptidase [Luteimonas sp. Y-2-2-4F]